MSCPSFFMRTLILVVGISTCLVLNSSNLASWMAMILVMVRLSAKSLVLWRIVKGFMRPFLESGFSLNPMGKARSSAWCWRIGVISSLEATVHRSRLNIVDVVDMMTDEDTLRFNEKDLERYFFKCWLQIEIFAMSK